MTRVLPVGLALLLGSAALGAQVRELPPEAQLLLRRDAIASAIDQRSATQGLISAGRAREAVMALTRAPDGTLLVDVVVRGRGAERALRAAGARLGTRAGQWVTGRVAVSQVRAVARAAGVDAVELAPRAKILDDSAEFDIRSDVVRKLHAGGHFDGATGRGAIVGFVDTGIDYRHPDFLDDDLRRSRILYLWDQTVDGSGPGTIGGVNFDYGVECDRESLSPGAASLCEERDVDGHGTHVAGIATGDGSGRKLGPQDFAFAGVAPGAELIVVKTDLSFASIIDGVNYVFRRADALGRPAVVNLSLGSQFGPHDGNSAISLAIDALTGPGHLVVVAAGNEGRSRMGNLLPSMHAEGIVPAGGSKTFQFGMPLYTPRPGQGNDLVLMQAFHSPKDTFTVVVKRPNGTTVTLPTIAAVITSNDVGGTVIAYHGSIPGDSILGEALEAGSFASASPSATTELYVGEWIDGGQPPGAGLWDITFTRTAGSTGTGEIDLYLPLATTASDPTFTIGATNRRLIATPADARTVITTGAYSTRYSWDAVDGFRYALAASDSVPTGDLLIFSSPGPTRDGRRKPDIAAPGRVFSSLSRDALFPDPLIATDSMHALLEGTSMAAPHVAGAVALLLSRRPTLTPAQALTAITSGARTDAFTGAVPNDFWGYGKLDLPGATALVAPATGRAFAVVQAADTTLRDTRQGTRLVLQSMRVAATDAESLSVSVIAAHVSGVDKAFRASAVLDANRNGVADAGETSVGTTAPTALSGETDVVLDLPAASMVVPRGGTADVLLVAELSGATPNGTTFGATIDFGASRAVGLRSGASLALDGTTGSTVARTTLLASTEVLALSQNPVRTSELVINFGADARRVSLFDFAGRRIRQWTPLSGDRSLRWDLRSADGQPTANGSYILIVELAQRTERRTIFVAR